MKSIARIGLLIIGCLVAQGTVLQACSTVAMPGSRSRLVIDKALKRYLVALGTLPENLAYIVFGYAPELLSQAKLCTLDHEGLKSIAPLCAFSEDGSTLFTATLNGCCADESRPGYYYRSSYCYAHCPVTGTTIAKDTCAYDKTYTFSASSDLYPTTAKWDLEGGALKVTFACTVPEIKENKHFCSPSIDGLKSLHGIIKPKKSEFFPPRFIISSDQKRLAVVRDSGDEKHCVQVWELTSKEAAYRAYAWLAKEKSLRQGKKRLPGSQGCCVVQ